MKNLVIICSLFLLVSCGAGINDVKEGMSEQEVEEMLGSTNHKNSTSSSYTANGVVEEHSRSTWKYDGKGTITFEDGKVVSVSAN